MSHKLENDEGHSEPWTGRIHDKVRKAPVAGQAGPSSSRPSPEGIEERQQLLGVVRWFHSVKVYKIPE